MRLTAAARYFDKEKVYDAYTGAYLFNAQTSSFDDHSSSGATSRRRTMSTKAGTVPPARHVVTIMGEPWLVGASNPDGWQGGIIRLNFNLKKATGLMAKLTPAQACDSAAGTSMYTQKQYFKDTVNMLTDADSDVMWNVFCPTPELVVKGDFFREGTTFYRVRNAYDTIEGLTIAESDQLDADAYQVAAFIQSGTLNLLTDQRDTSMLPVGVLQTDMMKFYKFAAEADDIQKPGDRTVFVSQAQITPEIGSELLMQNKRWRVLSVTCERDAWALHVRLA